MSDPMAEIRASFFVESEELIESLFDALQSMSDGRNDTETINTAFRAVHSIKGGAGAFALDDLVDFAHHFETVMDDLRSSRLAIDDSLIALFYRCGDILSDLVRSARDGGAADRSSVDPVIEALKSFSSAAPSDTSGDTGSDASQLDFQPLTLDLGNLDFPDSDDAFFEPAEFPSEPSDDTRGTRGLSVYFKPERELYASGNEPLFLLRSLGDLGPMDVAVEFEAPSDMQVGSHPRDTLAWRIKIDTEARRHAVEEVFEFVNGLCVLEISEARRPEEKPGAPVGPVLDPRPAHADLSAGIGENLIGSPERVDKHEVTIPAGEALPASKAAPSATVRVDLARIDRLVNLVGELVINQSMLSQSVIEAQLPPNSAISSGLEEFLQLTRDIQESVMMIRAQPVKSLFQRMSRIVREASAAVGKKVSLTTDGENTEIDKTVIERLADPLTHMIRNAVDHGLESADARLSAGKSETGRVKLTAMHRSGRVVIEISDDGAGINRQKVFRIAVEKGLVPAEAQLTDNEIDQLLFMPGFSTADQVSNLSGRGVGMDVVKNAIAALGGRIAIKSIPGNGTTFSISLPLTLAVQDGMVVTVANETLVMPLNAIVETLTLRDNDIRRLGPRTNVVLVRDAFVPLLDLGVELGYREPLRDYASAIALLVGQEDGNKAALIVDTIEDQRQVVIKGLQESYGRVAGVAAATILGDGQIALILDAADLVQNAIGHSGAPLAMEVS